MVCAQVINESLKDILHKNPHVMLVGEDIEDPYGGAFKITKGLSSLYPAQVLSTPISEAALTGLCAGLSSEGYIPVLEIMFGDFTSLIFDQVLNHLSKFRGMYNFQISPHIVIRAPMGGGRGYGPTHSQCLEKFFLGVPGLDIISFSEFHNIPEIYEDAILRRNKPVFIAEYKNIYSSKYQELGEDVSLKKNADFTAFSFTKFQHDDTLILTYGGPTKMCLDIAKKALFEHEIYSSVVSFNNLKSFRVSLLENFIKDNMKILTVEESGVTHGWGAYMLSVLNQRGLLDRQSLKVKCVGSMDYPVPSCSKLENTVLVNGTKIMESLMELVQ
jgi:pyruvate/2-oxoglutarate/acetoin dehydrogenase E1 component